MLKFCKKYIRNFFCIALVCFVGFLSSCRTVSTVALVGGFLGEVAGIEGSEDIALSIIDSAESIEKAMEDFTPEQEYYIGRAVAASILTKYDLYDSPRLERYLNQICASLIITSDVPTLYKGYSVGILDTDEINAFATSGGHIMISRGLIRCATSEDALAAVLAHEIAHIQLQHSLDAIQTSRVTDAITKTSYAALNILTEGELRDVTNALGDVVDDIIGEMVDSGYSKSQEFEADEKALAIMAKAGYYPKAMNDMLLVLKEKSNAKTGWGKTHPSPKDRMKNLENLYKKYSVKDSRESRQARFLEATKGI